METKKCPACGEETPADAEFCPHCGNIPPAEAVPTPEEPSADGSAPLADSILPVEATVEASPAPLPKPPKKLLKRRKKRRWWSRLLCGFGSGILLTLAIVIGIAAGAVQTVQQLTTTESIRDMVAEIDLPSLEVTVNGQSKSVSNAIYDSFTDAQIEEHDLSQEKIDELLKTDFAQQFLTDTTNSYVEGLVEGTGSGEVNADDITELLRTNRSEIERILGMKLTDDMIDRFVEQLKKDKVLEELSVSNIMTEAPQVQKAVQTVTTVFSPATVILIWAILLFVLLLIALVNFFRPISLAYAGAVLLFVGAIYGAIALLIDKLAELASNLLSIPSSLLSIVTGAVSNAAFGVFLIGAIAGAVCIVGAIVYTVLRKVLYVRAERKYALQCSAALAEAVQPAAEASAEAVPSPTEPESAPVTEPN